MITIPTILLRFALSFFASFWYGLDRQKLHKPVGFGTYIFVTVGACALALAAILLYPENPLPLLSAIVTGIGFLGAGALLKTSDKIFGFTTAASIWVFAIFGLLVGIGNYLVAILLYGLIWATIFFDKRLEQQGVGSYRKRMTITVKGIGNTKETEGLLKESKNNFIVISTEIDKEHDTCTIHYLVEGSKHHLNDMIRTMNTKKWCNQIKVE